MIEIVDGLVIPEQELNYKASRSGGPGGQNVNKVSSRVTLQWDVTRSASISEDQRARLLERLASRINKNGVLQITSQKTRSQELNRSDVLARFVSVVQEAMHTDPPRVETTAPKAAHNQRLAHKKRRTQTKQLRAKREWDE